MARSRDDDPDPHWEYDAKRAVDEALENADFDDVRGVIALPDDLSERWTECEGVDEVARHLEQLYDAAWYAGVPFDGGEAVFRGDAQGYVGDAMADNDVEGFFDAVRAPDDAEEIISSSELVDDVERSRLLRIDLEDINDELIRYLAKHPEIMHHLDPRKFEEVVAALFKAKGYAVELTPRARDGGVDIIAIEKGDLGSAMTVIECKRYAMPKKVGVGIVRGLYGVVEERRATRGLIATTSYFTRDAETFREKLEYRLALADYDRMAKFFRDLRGRR